MTFITNPQYLTDGDGQSLLVLAHGAGAPMDSPFMTALARKIGSYGIRVVRFEFAYMHLRREDGRKRPPPKAGRLIEEFRQHLRYMEPHDRLFIGGKSMGGRIASMLGADAGDLPAALAGCLCFGYPFHPPGKPDSWRTDHFDHLRVPLRIVQGTRDPFGRASEAGLITQALQRLPPGTQPASATMALHWLDEGNHDYHPRKRSGRTQQELIDEAAKTSADWMRNQT